MKFLVLSPHIDDAEFAMGGTLIKMRDAGAEVVLAVLNADDGLSGDINVRVTEQRTSSKILKIMETIPLAKDMRTEDKIRELDKVEASVIYFPLEADSHQHHIAASQIGFAVARKVPAVYRYFTNSTLGGFPNHLEVINIEKKKKLASVFKSQTDRNPKFMEIMVAQNRFFGSLIPGNGHYAEGFVLFRDVNY
jgi:LmbE family N-acetylglucosaminyl deacetylase